jgi:hypothetical protein
MIGTSLYPWDTLQEFLTFLIQANSDHQLELVKASKPLFDL